MNNLIIDNLKIYEDYNRIYGDTYKANAYKKVINNIENLNVNIKKVEDIKNLNGIGKSILEKIKQILEKGKIENIDNIINDKKYKLSKDLSKIYGVGPSSIKVLLEKIEDIEDLNKPEFKNLLNDKQKIGLKYYKDLELRITKDEAKKHYNIIKSVVKTDFEMVGSYRRGCKDIGDIDILIKNNNTFILKSIIETLIDKKYIIEKLSLGKNKFMGIVKLNPDSPARRIDILVADESYYYYALLYFTGSYNFNIEMRKKALEKGLSLSEYGFKDNNTKELLVIEDIKNEEDIFKYLNMPYVKPNKR